MLTGLDVHNHQGCGLLAAILGSTALADSPGMTCQPFSPEPGRSRPSWSQFLPPAPPSSPGLKLCSLEAWVSLHSVIAHRISPPSCYFLLPSQVGLSVRFCQSHLSLGASPWNHSPVPTPAQTGPGAEQGAQGVYGAQAPPSLLLTIWGALQASLTVKALCPDLALSSSACSSLLLTPNHKAAKPHLTLFSRSQKPSRRKKPRIWNFLPPAHSLPNLQSCPAQPNPPSTLFPAPRAAPPWPSAPAGREHGGTECAALTLGMAGQPHFQKKPKSKGYERV